MTPRYRRPMRGPANDPHCGAYRTTAPAPDVGTVREGMAEVLGGLGYTVIGDKITMKGGDK